MEPYSIVSKTALLYCCSGTNLNIVLVMGVVWNVNLTVRSCLYECSIHDIKWQCCCMISLLQGLWWKPIGFLVRIIHALVSTFVRQSCRCRHSISGQTIVTAFLMSVDNYWQLLCRQWQLAFWRHFGRNLQSVNPTSNCYKWFMIIIDEYLYLVFCSFEYCSFNSFGIWWALGGNCPQYILCTPTCSGLTQFVRS